MRVRRSQEEVIQDVHLFLQAIYKEVDADPQTRMVYSAMTFHLPATYSGVLQQMGIVKKAGWNWYWMTDAPSEDLAVKVYIKHQELAASLRAIYTDRSRRSLN